MFLQVQMFLKETLSGKEYFKVSVVSADQLLDEDKPAASAVCQQALHNNNYNHNNSSGSSPTSLLGLPERVRGSRGQVTC